VLFAIAPINVGLSSSMSFEVESFAGSLDFQMPSISFCHLQQAGKHLVVKEQAPFRQRLEQHVRCDPFVVPDEHLLDGFLASTRNF
jgi:hypothetical protein